MEWRDEGVILSVRRHGETSAIAEILTAGHGRVMGLVLGALAIGMIWAAAWLGGGGGSSGGSGLGVR